MKRTIILTLLALTLTSTAMTGNWSGWFVGALTAFNGTATP